MLDNWIVILELSVSFLVAISVLGMVVWGLKSGQFDDGKKMSEGLLFDSNEDLQSAILAEQKQNKMKEKKQKTKGKIENDI